MVTQAGDIWGIVFGPSADAAVVNSAVGTIASGNSSGTISAFNCSGDDRLLIVDVAHDDDNLAPVVFQITRLGQSATFLRAWGSFQGNQRIERWYLINPIAGTGTLTVDFGSGNNVAGVARIAAYCISNVDQSSPFATDMPLFGGVQSASPTGTIQAAPGMLVLDGWISGDLTAGATPGAGQTELFDNEVTGGGHTVAYLSSWQRATGGGDVMSWSAANPSSSWKAGLATAIRGVRTGLVALPNLQSVSVTETINQLGSASFTAPYTEQINTLATIGREVSIYKEGEGEIWFGKIADRNTVIDDAEGVVMEFSGISLGQELQHSPTYIGIVTWPSDFTAQNALNRILQFHELGAPAVWTGLLSGGGFVNVTSRWGNMSIWQASLNFAEVENAFVRETHVHRQLEVSRALTDSGMVLTNVEAFATPSIQSVGGTIVVGSDSDAGVNASSLTFSHTVASGADRCLVVTVETRGGPVTGVTFNGVALTSTIAQASGAIQASVWRLMNPPVITANVVVSLTSAGGTVAGAVCLYNVDQASPVVATQVATGATSITLNVSGVTGGLVIDSVAGPDNGSGSTPTIGAGQTQLHQILQVEGDTRGLSSHEPGAATVTMSWTTLRSEAWQQAAASFRPTAASEILTSSQSSVGILEGGFNISEDGGHIANRVSAIGVDAGKVVLDLSQSNRSTPYPIRAQLRNLPTWTRAQEFFPVRESGGNKNIGSIQVVGEHRGMVVFALTPYLFNPGATGTWFDVGGQSLPPGDAAATITNNYTARGWYYDGVPAGDVRLAAEVPASFADPGLDTSFISIPIQDAGQFVATSVLNGIGTSAGAAAAGLQTGGEIVIGCVLTEGNGHTFTDAAWQQRIFTGGGGNLAVSFFWASQPGDGILWGIDSADDWAVITLTIKPKPHSYIEDLASIEQYGRRAEFQSENANKFTAAIGSAIQQAANTLYDREAAHLEHHKLPITTYEGVRCSLPKGPKQWLVGDGVRLIYRQQQPAIAIDELLYVIERTHSYDEGGARRWELTLSDEPAFPKSNVDLINEQLQRLLALEGLE